MSRFLHSAELLLFVAAIPTANLISQTSKPDEVGSGLRSPDIRVAASTAMKFNLTQLVYSADGKQDYAPCGSFHVPTEKNVWKENDDSLVMVDAYSDTCLIRFLVFFENDKNAWSYLGTASLSERYNSSTYSISDFTVEGKPLVLVRHNHVVDGTGIEQDNMQVYAFVQGSLRLVFNQPEHSSLGIPYKSKCCVSGYVDTQESTFKIIPPYENGDGPQIEEARRSKADGRALTVYRLYAWDRRWHQFESTPMVPDQ
jgi:hypothetical protein